MASHIEAGTTDLPSLSNGHLANMSSMQKDLKMDDLGVCASPGGFAPPKRKGTWSHENWDNEESIGGALRKFAMKHQLGLSLNFILLLAMSHALFPSLRETTKACFTLSYPTLLAGQWGQGPRDMYLVGSCVIYFTAVRAFMLDYVLLPLAELCGISTRKGKVRFAEQAYLLLYYVIYWSWGATLFVRNTRPDEWNVEALLVSLWRDFPTLTTTTSMKLYYLTQMAFWIQQIVVIHLEERRKDHYQMLTHHIVTTGLMVGSYGYRQMRVGNAILVLMDIVDLIFPTAKILRYLGLQTACDCAFGLFVITWIAARHVSYLSICWSIWEHVNNKAMFYGTYSVATGERLSADGGDKLLENLMQPMLNPEAETISFNANIRWAFLSLLMALQGITIVWLFMIIRVVIRVLRGHGADDSRSDDEGEDEEVDISIPISAQAETDKPRFIEVETTSDEVTWPSRTTKASNGRRKAKGISSGLNLGEHKEILNRIGCLSEEQLQREREKREGSASPQPPSKR